MDILSFLNRIFGAPREDTRSAARDRLRLVLVSDRATVAPHLMEALRNELIEVISRYMEIDTRTMQMGLERHEGTMALAANIPVRSVHRSSAEMPAVRLDAPPSRQEAARPAPREERPAAATAVVERPEPPAEREPSAGNVRLAARRRSRKGRNRPSRSE